MFKTFFDAFVKKNPSDNIHGRSCFNVRHKLIIIIKIQRNKVFLSNIFVI